MNEGLDMYMSPDIHTNTHTPIHTYKRDELEGRDEYTYMHTYTHTHIHAYTHTHIPTYTHTHIHT